MPMKNTPKLGNPLKNEHKIGNPWGNLDALRGKKRHKKGCK